MGLFKLSHFHVHNFSCAWFLYCKCVYVYLNRYMIYDTWNILSMLYCFGQLFLANTCRGAFFLTPQKKSGVVECGVFVRAFSFRMTPFGCRCVNNAPFFPLAQCRSSLGILATRRSKKSAWLKWSSFADNPCTFVFLFGGFGETKWCNCA